MSPRQCPATTRQGALDEHIGQQAARRPHFGGIDIVVNNASAIDLSSTDDISMKRYDLMQDINCRGSFLLAKLCLPVLRKSAAAERNPP